MVRVASTWGSTGRLTRRRGLPRVGAWRITCSKKRSCRYAERDATHNERSALGPDETRRNPGLCYVLGSRISLSFIRTTRLRNRNKGAGDHQDRPYRGFTQLLITLTSFRLQPLSKRTTVPSCLVCRLRNVESSRVTQGPCLAIARCSSRASSQE